MKWISILVALLMLNACTEISKKRQVVSVPDAILQMSLTKDTAYITNYKVMFSEQGANFSNPSHLKLDSIPILTDGFNISFWFRTISEEGAKTQTAFNAFDFEQQKDQFNMGIGGNRIGGNLNGNRLSNKDFSKETTASRAYFDLPKLEVGKYYFFSLNKFQNKIQIFVNAELYKEYELLNDTNITINTMILGAKKVEMPYRDQFIGAIRNFSMFDTILSPDQIYSLSVRHYKEIEPYNDAFELSKFNIEN